MSEGLRVLTCNLRSGGARARSLTAVIENHLIDIVCAQELTVKLAGVISELLPHGNMSHDQIHRGTGIASRFPVAEHRIPMAYRDGWYVTLSPQHWQKLSFPVEIVNVHICAPHLWPYFPRRVRRSAQLRALLHDRNKKKAIPQAIFGDFNASPIWPVYKAMAANFVDCIRSADMSSDSIKGTWPYVPQLGIRGIIRIDHCFLRNLSVNRVQKVEISGSDHLGLLVDLDVSASRAVVS